MSAGYVVAKFGGTSVSGGRGWDVIARRAREVVGGGDRVWLVASALAGVSDRLERAVEEAVAGDRPASLDWWLETHERFRATCAGGATVPGFDGVRDELERRLEGVRLSGEASPRLRARILACGELASTHLGVAALRARGIEARWVDARDLLRARRRVGDDPARRYLEADVRAEPDRGACESASAGAGVVLTQGFVAADEAGDTCLLGRGGSDTSGALFARMLEASALEIWTDVPGMFTADPRLIPSARRLRRVGYREARELAAMGAKVLHPRCLAPAEASSIPIRIRNTFDPDAPGTEVVPDSDEATVTAVACRTGVTLVTLSTLTMWGESGFLARAFRPFEDLDISVDLVATSQSAISVTLDRVPGGAGGEAFRTLVARLQDLGEVEVVRPCAVVSIVGRHIRAVLHELGAALGVFRERVVHLVSESSEDLNLSFVVDEAEARPLVRELHAALFPPAEIGIRSERFGETWERLRSDRAGDGGEVAPRRWWRERRDVLLEAVGDGEARYVYDLPTVADRARALASGVPSVDRWYYAMKANAHPDVLSTVVAAGFGLECVSAAEVVRAREVCGDDVPILFTPNFCPPEEYRVALDRGAEVTVDGPELLRCAPDLFRGVELGVRIDPGAGLGHHEKVRTAGPGAKFGLPVDAFPDAIEAADALGSTVVGLHAHVGSGIRDPAAWAGVLRALAATAAERLAGLRWIDVGGGIGVVERPGHDDVDLRAIDAALASVRGDAPGIELRMEPGRYLVAEAGVLVVPVTQVRDKGGVRFVGVATGMNSLLRPALYGAWHAIHNLSRIDRSPESYVHVVGPICETGDVLGRDRWLPRTEPGDVLLVETCGAYGAVMASTYNLRRPAREVVLND